MKLPIYIPSYGRPETCRTHKWLLASGEGDFVMPLHTQACLQEYLKNPTIHKRNLVVTDAPLGVTHMRRWIREQVPMGQWYVMIDDNVDYVNIVPRPHYEQEELPVTEKGFDKKLFTTAGTFAEWMDVVRGDIAHCEQRGINLIGYATVPNFYFLGKKYREVGYVTSKITVIRRTEADYDTKVQAMDDYAFCAEHLARFGKVLINNFVMPINGHYEAGGIGDYESRLPRKIADAEYLMLKYPELFRYKVKAGCHPKAELQFRFTSGKQVEKWRAEVFPMHVYRQKNKA